jgi:hypothetical protein
MSICTRHFALPVLALAVIAPIVLAAQAFADPPPPPLIPEAGSESAAATIGDLDDAGYDVSIQYENGQTNAPLSACAVTDINTVGSVGDQPMAYITINCPKS